MELCLFSTPFDVPIGWLSPSARMFRPGICAKRSVSVLSRRFVRPISLKPNFEKFKLTSEPPGHIVGDVNDPVPTQEADFYHSVYHWSYERIVAVTMVPLAVLPFVSGTSYPLLDTLLSTLILVHSNAGFQSCIIDYIPKRIYGVWHTYAMRLLAFGTCVGLYGVYELETKDEGITTLLKKLWTEPKARPISYFGY
ncbi:SDH5 [Cyberlindnera jadinii]|uniref:Succinate dehydrogenase [ubiquinone] cytochrome b small subunit n=2 Tax=Cyberlindnera jadinii (strain ATCC 18201 / CBS 1600 / BCRC 20928 / JCM 3617 / NBRC 0987 / NRRL Y-1542) TaxID=983966 RepID=A0A0H5CA80_CYBJN|nr:SDH5 [Cyberlindnera jadinii]